MNKAMKGAMLSGLVLPGLGQFFLKRHIRGAVLGLASVVCGAILVSHAADEAAVIIDKMDLTSGVMDPVVALKLIKQAAGYPAGPAVRIASQVLLFLWLVGTVDAFLIGRKEDLQECHGRQAR